jgi:hypothetical protein
MVAKHASECCNNSTVIIRICLDLQAYKTWAYIHRKYSLYAYLLRVFGSFHFTSNYIFRVRIATLAAQSYAQLE